MVAMSDKYELKTEYKFRYSCMCVNIYIPHRCSMYIYNIQAIRGGGVEYLRYAVSRVLMVITNKPRRTACTGSLSNSAQLKITETYQVFFESQRVEFEQNHALLICEQPESPLVTMTQRCSLMHRFQLK
jgi:hypothetical protein